MDEGTLRASLRKVGSTKRGHGCPDEQELAAFADGRLESAEKARVERHLVSCGDCRDQVAFLVRSEAEAGPLDTPIGLLVRARELVAEKPALAFGWIWRWGAATAVAAVLVFAVAIRMNSPEALPTPSPATPVAPAFEPAPPAPAPPKGAAADHAVRKTGGKTPLPEILFPQEGTVLSPEKVELRWKAVPGAILYQVQVVTAEGEIVWQGRTEATHVAAPLRLSVKPGGEYFLWVHAQLPDGRTVRSPMVSFKTSAP